MKLVTAIRGEFGLGTWRSLHVYSKSAVDSGTYGSYDEEWVHLASGMVDDRVLCDLMRCLQDLDVALVPQYCGIGITKPTIAATIGCKARKLALKYLFSNPASE